MPLSVSTVAGSSTLTPPCPIHAFFQHTHVFFCDVGFSNSYILTESSFVPPNNTRPFNR